MAMSGGRESAEAASETKSRGGLKSNGPIGKIASSIKTDWKSAAHFGTKAFEKDGLGFARNADRFMTGLGRGSFGKGLAKGGAYLGGAAIIGNWLFD